jgi:hypothetical protein
VILAIGFVIAVATLPAPCPGPVVDVTSWEQRDSRVFSYRLPLEFRKETGGTSNVTDYATTDGTSKVHVELGAFAGKLVRGEGVTEYASCWETIGGHEARVVTARDPDGSYISGATWAGAHKNQRLTMIVRTHDLVVVEQMLAAFRTVRIKAPS